MIGKGSRPSALGGLWALLVGGVAIVGLLLFLQPVTQRAECPNYGGNGNASAFANSAWDLYLPLVLLAWVVLIGVEQLLPVTWRGRGGGEIAARAVVAVVVAVVGSCCLFLSLGTVCR
jgi:hypothetical protein